MTVDTTPPVSAVSFLPPTSAFMIGPTTVLRPDTVIALSAQDASSGVGAIDYSLDGSTAVYTASFTPADQGITSGSHTLQWWATDPVGNQESVHRAALVVDNQPPAVTLGFAGGQQFTDPFGGVHFASGNTGFVITAADVGTAGVNHIEVNAGSSGGFQVYSGTFTLPARNAPQTIQYRAIDNVGNVSPTSLYPVVIVSQAPRVIVSTSFPVFVSSGVTYARSATQFP